MKKSLTTLALALAAFSAIAADWAPAGDRIKTKWAEEVSPANALPAYPRPQMVRGLWQNLNGLWDYAVTAKDADEFSPEGKILVPFCIESSLSGVGKKVSQDQSLWYERTFTVPKTWKGKDVILHFGAVDWQAEVWVNGVKLGKHTGGYTPFSFNVTPYLKKSGAQSLKVRVYDQVDLAWQPRGKQVIDPQGIWYTPVTGIWQTVWMEPVAKTHIENYYIVSDVKGAKMSINVDSEGLQAGDEVKFDLIEGGIGYSAEKPGSNILASASVVNGKAEINVPGMKTWCPCQPYLYGVKISILRKGKVIDSVDGYTAMRSITRLDAKDKTNTPNKDGKSFNCMAINGKRLFQMGPLDQGWWPDGLYTAPTDEALHFDVAKTKEWGFNMIRKHIKVEPARWYYWCDVEGIMVWQDMPCIGDHSFFRHNKGAGRRGDDLQKKQRNVWNTMAPATKGTDCDVPQEWKDNYYKEWSEIIASVKNFQCIVVWVPFNEGWGQFDTEKVVAFTRKQDSTRLINEASGGNYHFAGDIMDCHRYPSPMMPFFDVEKINVLGEFGGIGHMVQGHIWDPSIRNWGYNGTKKSVDEVTATYEDFAEMLKVLARTGTCAGVYTQTTDVEGEINGIMTYDRKVIKMDEARLKAANKAIIESFK